MPVANKPRLDYELRDVPAEFQIERKQFEDPVTGVPFVRFEAYAATWDLDSGMDRFVRGAFRKTIEERGPKVDGIANKSDRVVSEGDLTSDVKILWQHRDIIGIPERLKEDSNGLWVRGRIMPTTQGRDAIILLRSRSVDKMSIGFRPVKFSFEDGEESGGMKFITRIIREAALFEASPVTFPMNETTAITDVKSGRRFVVALDNLPDLSARLSSEEKAEPAPPEPGPEIIPEPETKETPMNPIELKTADHNGELESFALKVDGAAFREALSDEEKSAKNKLVLRTAIGVLSALLNEIEPDDSTKSPPKPQPKPRDQLGDDGDSNEKSTQPSEEPPAPGAVDPGDQSPAETKGAAPVISLGSFAAELLGAN